MFLPKYSQTAICYAAHFQRVVNVVERVPSFDFATYDTPYIVTGLDVPLSMKSRRYFTFFDKTNPENFHT